MCTFFRFRTLCHDTSNMVSNHPEINNTTPSTDNQMGNPEIVDSNPQIMNQNENEQTETNNSPINGVNQNSNSVPIEGTDARNVILETKTVNEDDTIG